MTYLSADNQPVEAGRKFWSNDLRVVEVTEVARYSNSYQDCTQTWHKTTGGDFDTMSGDMQQYGRLARRFEGKDAEDYEPGTNYSDAKEGK